MPRKGSRPRIDNIWDCMKRRCKRNEKGYEHVTVCDEWANSRLVFIEWAMNNGYTDELTLDRIDNAVGYEPSNCRWITRAEQNRNHSRAIMVNMNGETRTVRNWCEVLGLNHNTIYTRIKRGMSPQEALCESKSKD